MALLQSKPLTNLRTVGKLRVGEPPTAERKYPISVDYFIPDFENATNNKRFNDIFKEKPNNIPIRVIHRDIDYCVNEQIIWRASGKKDIVAKKTPECAKNQIWALLPQGKKLEFITVDSEDKKVYMQKLLQGAKEVHQLSIIFIIAHPDFITLPLRLTTAAEQSSIQNLKSTLLYANNFAENYRVGIDKIPLIMSVKKVQSQITNDIFPVISLTLDIPNEAKEIIHKIESQVFSQNIQQLGTAAGIPTLAPANTYPQLPESKEQLP